MKHLPFHPSRAEAGWQIDDDEGQTRTFLKFILV